MSRGRKLFIAKFSEDNEVIFWKNLPTYIKIINQFFQNEDYSFINVSDAIMKLSFSIPKGLNSKEIRKDGKYPVISQSQEYIIGFSDREDLVVQKDLPLVIFGDHSKTIKIVDQSFIIGADGVKIIKPKSEYNEKFFYFLLYGVITDTKSYGRHFSLLKKGLIPSGIESKLQLKIVEFLENLKNGTLKREIFFDRNIEEKIISIHTKYALGIKLSNTHFQQLTQIENLNQAILQEAVQGKLLKQDSDDEPASELLKLIKAEKAKTGKKEKPLPPIKLEEIPFEIPENWVWCRLGEIIQYTENLDIQKYLSPYTIVNYVDIDAIDNQNFIIREAKQKSVRELSTRARRVLKPNFIAYSTVRPYLKNIAIVEEEKENYIGSTGFNVFKTLNVELKYAFYYLLTPYVNNSFKDLMVGFNSPSITNVQFEKSLLPLPPLSEQKRIVEEIEKQLTKTKKLKEHIIANQQATEQLLKALLHQAFEKKIDTV